MLRDSRLRLAAFLLLAWSAPGAALAQPSPRSGSNPIRIGVAGPITGPYGYFGRAMKAGAEQAVADINAQGGLFGRDLALEVGDDACRPEQAAEVARRLAETGVAFVAGHFCSGSSIAASRVYAEERVIQISPASTHPFYTDERPDDVVFRVCGRADQEGEVAGQFLASRFANRNVAIVHDASRHGTELAEATRRAMNRAGTSERLYLGYETHARDFSDLAARLRAERIDVLYVGGDHIDAAHLARTLRERDMDTVLVGGDGLATDEFWEIAGKAGEGTFMTLQPDPRYNPQSESVVRALRRRRIDPDMPMLYAYAAVQTWAQAVEKAGSIDAREVAQALHDAEFDTVLGRFRFDRKGDTSLPSFIVYVWRRGAYRPL